MHDQLWNYLFPLFVFLLAVGQRRYDMWGWVSLFAEFFLLVTVSFLGTKTATVCLFLPYALLFALDYRIYQRMGGALDVNALRFGLSEPAQSIDLFRTEFGWKGLGILITAISAALLTAFMGTPSSSTMMVVVSIISMFALCVGILRAGVASPVPSLLSALVAMARMSNQPIGLSRAVRARLPLETASKGNTPNVLVIVIESLCKRLLHSPEGVLATPRYHAFLARQADRVVPFPSALCNSTVSLMSYPSIFTGLSPDESRERFHSNPLIWAQAKAKGYSTSFYTSQSLRWCNFDDFLIDDTLDRAVYLETLNAPIAYALAMDDRELNKVVLADLVQMNGPFFSVVNYHSLHFPYSHKESQALSEGDGTNWRKPLASSKKEKSAPKAVESLHHYVDALHRLDGCLGDLLDALESSGKMESTAIFFTSDHGEAPELMYPGTEVPMMLRLDDFNSDVLRVPFWVYLPKDSVPEQKEKQLRANSGAIVSNIDIYPSVMDLLGFDAAKRREWSSGQSIFDPINPERNVMALNTGAIRQWKFEPFALAREGWLLIYHDVTKLLDLIRLNDPQESNLWESLSPSEQEAWFAKN